MVKAIYIHIPFCNNICSYCSFCKMYSNNKIIDEYLEALYHEIKNNYLNEELTSIYIGGGTPSDLDIDKLEKLFQIISLFKKSDDCEITFESNISITEEKLLLLKKYGVNRLSFGIESISDRLLKIMERKHTKEEVLSKIKICRDLGFSNINGDLIYAFNDESIDELREDINFLLQLNLEHISCYSLIIEEHTKLFLRGYNNCKEELDAKMYEVIHNVLTEQGYIHYEVSNFSKEGYCSRHNLVYWHNEEYYGFGLGASGYVKKIRYKNTCNFQKYINKMYRYEVEKLDNYDKMSYEMILGLRLTCGVNCDVFFKKYCRQIEEVFSLEDYLDKHYLEKKNNYIYIPFDKWYVMNFILERFVK